MGIKYLYVEPDWIFMMANCDKTFKIGGSKLPKDAKLGESIYDKEKGLFRITIESKQYTNPDLGDWINPPEMVEVNGDWNEMAYGFTVGGEDYGYYGPHHSMIMLLEKIANELISTRKVIEKNHNEMVSLIKEKKNDNTWDNSHQFVSNMVCSVH